MSGIVKIHCKKYLCCEKFDSLPSLARFTLRDEGRTIAYGEILKVKPAKWEMKSCYEIWWLLKLCSFMSVLS